LLPTASPARRYDQQRPMLLSRQGRGASHRGRLACHLPVRVGPRVHWEL